MGLIHKSALYYYLYNLQGDVVGIVRAGTGQVVARYSYDAWGKCTVTNASGFSVGRDNPFRYRGYYYDAETGFYYLNSRYYNPEWGRFISADVFVSTGQGLTGANMFAYCGNNPVNNRDSYGKRPESCISVCDGGRASGNNVYAFCSGLEEEDRRTKLLEKAKQDLEYDTSVRFINITVSPKNGGVPIKYEPPSILKTVESIATYGGVDVAIGAIPVGKKIGKVVAKRLGYIGLVLSVASAVALDISKSIPEEGVYCCYDITVTWVCENPHYERGLPSSFIYSVSYSAAWDVWRERWTSEP